MADTTDDDARAVWLNPGRWPTPTTSIPAAVTTACICPRHHTLLHQGFYAAGNAKHSLTFHRPDHTPINQSAAADCTV